MRRFTPFLLLLGLLAWPLKAWAAAEPDLRPAVDVIKVDGIIDRAMSDYLLGALDDADVVGGTAVIQLNTLGTLGVAGEEIAGRIEAMEVPVVVWVGPPGSHAAGAGMSIVEAADVASVSPGSGVGPAGPADLASNGVAGGKEMTSQQAIDAGVTQELQPDEAAPSGVIDLLGQIDGKVVDVPSGSVVLRTAVSSNPREGPGVDLRYHDLGPWRRVIHAVSSPTAVYILLVLAFAGFAFELTQPGFGFAGISGIVALGLAGYGLFSVAPNWLGLALLVLGPVLAIADLQLQKLAWLSGLGLLSLAAGSSLIYGDVADAIRIPIWVIVATLVASALYYGFALTVAQQAHRRIATAQQGLVGLTGQARGDVDPEGGVVVKGTVWRARTVGDAIPAGTNVRVRGVDGLILRVEPEPGEGSD